MTRLTTDDIINIVVELDNYEKALISRTGCSLTGIAYRAAGIRQFQIQDILKNVSVGVIPIAGGEGIIAGFCDSVAGIISHIGFKTFVTQATDAAGLAEAFEKKTDIIMLADDFRFVAVHTPSRQVVDNAVATAKGYVAGLSLMAGGLKQKDVLVLGCGPVGRKATEELVKLDARVSVYDIDPSRCTDLIKDLAKMIKQSLNTKIRIAKELDQALADHGCIVDATPAENIIHTRHIKPGTYVSAPGVPCGLSPGARSKISKRLLHDPLQIGVATMVFCALKYHLQIP